jgi:hypothetical protein
MSRPDFSDFGNVDFGSDIPDFGNFTHAETMTYVLVHTRTDVTIHDARKCHTCGCVPAMYGVVHLQ